MAKYSLFKVIYTNWGKDISEHHLGCCTLTMVQSKNVSSPSCIYSAFHCLCLSAIPIKMSNISIFFFFFFFLLLPVCVCRGSALLLFIDLTWHDRDTQEDTHRSTRCHVNMHRRRWAQGGEKAEKYLEKPQAPAVLAFFFFFFRKG